MIKTNLGNINHKPEDCIMGCMECGVKTDLCLIATRNQDGSLTGYIVMCHDHADEASGKNVKLLWDC